MLESINEIKKSLDLLRGLYASLVDGGQKMNSGFLLLFRSAIDCLEDETYLIESMIHGSIEDKDGVE